MISILRIITLISLVILATGCQNMESRKVGLRFWKLPTALGGGLSTRVYASGELVLDYPFISKLYIVDAGKKDFSFKATAQSDSNGALETRALDGNEVTLEVTVTYEIEPDGEKLSKLFKYVGDNPEAIEEIVLSVTRSDVRTFMNELRTSQFIDSNSSYAALRKVQESMNKRLSSYGIKIAELKLDRFYFDDDYESLLKQIQQIGEDVKRERERKLVVQKQMERDNATAVGVKNAAIKEAEGYRELRVNDGVNYLKEKENEAQAILATATAERDSLKKKIAALSGSGGSSLVKLELVKQLLKNQPQFIVVGKGVQEGQLNVNRVDTNKLIEQAKVFEALRDDNEKTSKVTNNSLEK